MALQVLLNLELQGSVKHAPCPLQADLVERATRVLTIPFAVDLDYVGHRWRVLPLWPTGADVEPANLNAIFSIHDLNR